MGAIETQRSRAAADWLTATHPNPGEAIADWRRCGLALFPVGTAWDIIKLGPTNPAEEAEQRPMLTALGITGPVAHDPYLGVYFVLVPVGTAATWKLAGTEARGDSASAASFIGLPSLGRFDPTPPHRLRWVIPPDGTGHLTDPEQLHAALVARANTTAATAEETP